MRLAWIATGALLFYLHYTAVLLLAAEMAYCAIVGVLPRLSRAGDRDQPVGYRWRQLTLDLTLLGLCLLPAVPHLREIAQRRQNWFSFVSVRSWWRIWEIGDVFPLHLYVLTPLAILAFSLAGERIRRQPAACGSCRDVRWFLLASCWLLVPLAVAWVATAQGYAPLFFRRYLIVAAVAPILWAALCCAACAPGFWRGACAVVVVVAAVYQGGMIRQWRHDGRVVGDRNQDWHSAVAYINQQAAAGAPVFVRSGLIEAERWYAAQDPLRREFCLLPVLGLYRLERPLDQLFPLPVRPAAYLSAEARHLVLSSGEAWLLVQGSEASLARFETSLRSVWRQAGVPTAAVERRGFGNVAVLHVRLTLSPSLSRHARREAGPP